MDYRVATVRVPQAAQIEAYTSVPGLAVEPIDPTDNLAPAAWVLSALLGTAPFVRRVTVAQVDASAAPGTATAFLLDLDAPLTPGAGYQLGLAARARAFGSLTTVTATVPFTAPQVAGVAAQAVGQLAGDIAFPVTAPSGDIALADKLTALQTRLMLYVSARRGAFAHAETIGRSLEPKRNYSAGQLGAEKQRIAALIVGDPDVSDASVAIYAQGHAVFVAITVQPVFAPDPLVLPAQILAGASS